MQCPFWIINGTWYNTIICSVLHGYLLLPNVTDKIIMCSIQAHGRKQKFVNYEASSSGGRPLQ